MGKVSKWKGKSWIPLGTRLGPPKPPPPPPHLIPIPFNIFMLDEGWMGSFLALSQNVTTIAAR